MKSKIAEKILAETPKEIREAVKLYGDVIVDAYNRGYKKGFDHGNIKTNVVRPAEVQVQNVCDCHQFELVYKCLNCDEVSFEKKWFEK